VPATPRRACLNQEDIEGSLSHLPVHIAGCKGLLVIAGTTYTQRLWTLLELYVWVAMGKEHDTIKVLVLSSATCLLPRARSLHMSARMLVSTLPSPPHVPTLPGRKQSRQPPPPTWPPLRKSNSGRSSRDGFKRLSVEAAQCSSAQDREKILAIIETSFNSLKAFDAYISKLLIEVTTPERRAVLPKLPKKLLSFLSRKQGGSQAARTMSRKTTQKGVDQPVVDPTPQQAAPATAPRVRVVPAVLPPQVV
jgi:hypothetical protein